ncbi:hypothetical protein [Aestuariirhabdus litorea]|uniref:hypothetical protein n=1 Tax=Aestuariirhabdus litorea TaxID=2528527 RepID=UPI0013E34F80|nr:hypothetical protein [Aestuariirhabdus litorea]
MQRSKPFNFIEAISSQQFAKKAKKAHEDVEPLFKSKLMTFQIPAVESNDGFVRSYN